MGGHVTQGSSCSLLSLPDSLIHTVFTSLGFGAAVLALTCKPMWNLWEGDPKYQAKWLLNHSSNIWIKDSTKPRLEKLAELAEKLPGVCPMEVLRLKWTLQASAGTGRYGTCKCSHADGVSCRFSLDKPYMQGASVTAGPSCSLMPASLLLRLDKESMQAHGLNMLCAAACAVEACSTDANSSVLERALEILTEVVGTEEPLVVACKSQDYVRVKQLLDSRYMQQMPAKVQAETEAIAILNGNTTLFRLLVAARAARMVMSVPCLRASAQTENCKENNVQEDAQLKFIISHQRNPIPFLEVCFQSTAMLRNDQLRLAGESRQLTVGLLVSAGCWAAAHTFVTSLTDRDDGAGLCWDALGLAYLTKTEDTDRWPAGCGPGQLWETVIECARNSHIRWFANRPGTDWKRLWLRVFRFSFSKGGSEAALDVAEEAADWIFGKAELGMLANEHRRTGREVKARRCERTAKETCF